MTQHNHFDHDFVEDSNTSKNPEFSQIVAKPITPLPTTQNIILNQLVMTASIDTYVMTN
ncbi:MAG: hypothetical protein IE936_06690 [Moraxella osloensis]|nr:hypothetical protein [Moraxella osloensis]MBD3726741.1 hypothetical protein [Moraxella osloensis]MBW4019498.1 hypothetical protein [Moraxella osloensis]